MVNIIVSSDSRYPINKLSVQAAVLGIMQRHKIRGNVEIGVTVVGDRKMHAINKSYRGINATTNILSFALEDPASHIPRIGFVKAPDKILRLGDILISYPELLKDAALEGVSVEDQMVYLVEHGTRHLLGIHHD